MTEAIAVEQARAGANNSGLAVISDPHPLAGVGACADLAEREGLGPPLEEELPSGYLLDGRFVIREAIGRSAMATIYRADDQLRGGVVAVKIPLMKVENDPASFGRFQREERICSTLCGPLLLKFVPVDDAAKSRPYFVTEFLDGCTLAYVIHRRRPLPEADALRIASVACQALGQMHARRIVHRDVKPANIMICRDQRLCLLDFGLAAEVNSDLGLLSSLTPLFGTPEYMAPEQVRNKHNDERTDIYSLGVILYQMLTGVLPFQSEDPWASAQLRVTGDPAAPRSINPAITPQAEEIVLRAMQRRPEDRYQTVAAFRADLDHPDRVHVTGLNSRLEAPRFQISLMGTPILAGVILGVGVLLGLVGLFFVLMRHH
jgi:serine/threonine-protein kinase